MPRVLVITTQEEQLPKNCLDCFNNTCNLPTKGKYQDQIKKAYWTKRHKDCPFAFVDSEQLQPVKKSRV